ncbi:YfiR family protein [Desulfobacula toluolica]|uniref:Conserved uncharacterized protein n=1 Tax=Desulfobacula toluolica (strain DSM 7467 / Tol2) TaxID=651182 RepID=K0NCA3_DESTT|nr:YfiR family protein [Desulfobacula toluolica]CCK78446.1 conserved uncharacterized protein [Desulfobacula toluolica Tol2]
MTLLHNFVIYVIKKMIISLIVLLIIYVHAEKTVMADEIDEYAVKAAFTFNFISFIQWPETSFAGNTAPPYRIGFMGDILVAKRFNALNKKNNGTRTIHVRRLSTPEDCRECDIVFISRDIDRKISEKLLLKLKGKPVLTIGETKEFIKLGGVINFFSKNDRLQFEINPGAAKKQGLKLSSRLLNLAVIVGEQK